MNDNLNMDTTIAGSMNARNYIIGRGNHCYKSAHIVTHIYFIFLDKLFSKKEEESSPAVDLDIPVVNASNVSMRLSSQVQGQKPIVTDQEVEVISQTLSNIKSIALATGQELDLQNDNINKLTSTVDNANQRIQEHNKRIKQLT